MDQIHSLELNNLIDMLAEHMDEYTRMLGQRYWNEEEFSRCRERVQQIQEAIERLQKLDEQKSATG